MKNAVGREIPEEILELTGKEPFQGNNYKDNVPFVSAAPTVHPVMDNQHSKLVKNIREALEKCNAHDGMTVSFHHHFREGDLIVNMVMNEIHNMGLKNIKLAATSLGKAHEALVPMIEDGTITSIEASGVRGKIGEAISAGKLKGLAIMRSHGGRVRSVMSGETKVDIAFIGAPTSDDYGNLSGTGGKTNCGVISYSAIDADCADYVVAITDCLVPFPNYPAQVSMTKVDYVCVVDAIGIPEKIATGAAKPTTDQRKLMMAEYCTQVVVNTPYFKDGFSYQTGVGGASIASTISLTRIMEERGVKMGFGIGGLTKPMCDLLEKGLVDCLMDTQAFDLDAVTNIENPKHYYITASEYANPFNKGAFVNKLDYVILASLEVDVHFNCNVVVGSDGVITGAQGGHPDTAQGAKCTIVICPLLQGRIPAICTDVTTVTTPGESVDIVVTDYGVAVNPNRPDLLEALQQADCVPLKTIEELRDIAYSITGTPDPVVFNDRVVGIIEARDGTIMDVVRQVKPVSEL
ncbi:MAG TPA: citrate lyase subunit alpha [Erysipelotrichaceae bacterium]|jgi:citrate lyase subunit alpha/citrate CoA-transferase|nr:citrate lyase subunit alpha [Erysipelotrichaceae bacterium]